MGKHSFPFLAVLLLATPPAIEAKSGLPSDFPAIQHMSKHALSPAPRLLVAKAKKSKCGAASGDMSQLGLSTALITRPSSGDELYVDYGTLSDGTQWAALRRRNDPSTLYCGFVAVPHKNESHVYVVGVRSSKEDEGAKAIASGKFFCACRRLSK